MGQAARYMSVDEMAKLDKKGTDLAPDEKRFKPVRRVLMTFDEFMDATRTHERTVARCGGGRPRETSPAAPPYLGCDVLLRKTMEENDGTENIGPHLKRDLMASVRSPALVRMIEDEQLPPLNQMHLFVGSARTLYHCHYDLQVSTVVHCH